MTPEEMVRLFSLERIGPSPSRFDHEKLLWLNGQVLAGMEPAALVDRLRPFGIPDGETELLSRAIALHLSRCRTLKELAQALEIYGDDPGAFDAAGLKKFGAPGNAPVLRTLAERFSAVAPFAHASLEEEARKFAAESGLSLGALAQPVRLSLTGSLASPPLFELLEVLGKETSLRRIRAFADRIAAAPASPAVP